jgi:hypothetical protein
MSYKFEEDEEMLNLVKPQEEEEEKVSKVQKKST